MKHSSKHDYHVPSILFCLLIVLHMLVPGSTPAALAATQQVVLQGPEGSEAFGSQIVLGANGTFLVVDPGYDANGISNVGAIFLYGADYSLLTMITGSYEGDSLGVHQDSIVVLKNGNYVVSSPRWNNCTGAITYIDSRGGLYGIVSEQNSLIGNQPGDCAGTRVMPLNNGNYLVISANWSNKGASHAGAVTWGNGQGGTVGIISEHNSLVGSHIDDWVGGRMEDGQLIDSVTLLGGSHYVLRSPYWDNGLIIDAGAVTWGDGNGGTVGEVSASNSLVGSHAFDKVGTSVTSLSNGNFVVSSPSWANNTITNAGAVTWGNGNGGTVGEVSAANSLVGSHEEDTVGLSVTVLNNSHSHYVVSSPYWDNTMAQDAGAITWANGAGGTVGELSPTNSLVGSHSGDRVGLKSIPNQPLKTQITLLDNGNYIISSPDWNSISSTNVGAITWGNGNGGTVGEVSASNSLIGSRTTSIFVLTNGNYLVVDPEWSDGSIMNAGSVTWGNAQGGVVGLISAENSLIGSHPDDRVGSWMLEISNGHYVIGSPYWDNGYSIDAGAVTWGNKNGGTVGTVNANNSLVGSHAYDEIGIDITPLKNGNYVVNSAAWDNGNIINAGAVTWANGNGSTVGEVSASNSLVGTHPNDQVGYITELINGNYVVTSIVWDNGTIIEAGAVTWASGLGGTVGEINASNSLVGSHNQDYVGGVIPLFNGNYVVRSYTWDNGTITNAGAVTWANGSGGIVGEITVNNSLVGSHMYDYVGYTISRLMNGNYIVGSSDWDNDSVEDVGAVTWGNGRIGIVGEINATNSLVGEQKNDYVGTRVLALPNGNYVVSSPFWSHGEKLYVGAVTWVDGTKGIVGTINASNSLIGRQQEDYFSVSPSMALFLENGEYIFYDPFVSNGDIKKAGVVTFCDSTGGPVGEFSPPASVVGSVAGDWKFGAIFDTIIYDEAYDRVLVGKSNENRVFIIQNLSITSSAPPAGTVGQFYTHTFTTRASGMNTFSVSSGSLPPGLTLSPDGVLSGTPTQAGDFSFTVTVANGSLQESQQVTVHITDLSEWRLHLPMVGK